MEISLPLIVQLISGAFGGILAGSILKKFSLGTLGNSLVGILGGGIGGQLLEIIGISVSRGGTNLEGVIGNILSGVVGGSVFIIVIGLIKKVLSK